MLRFHQMMAEAALNRIGAILSFEHEWDASRDCGSGLPMPGPVWARRLLGDSYFAKPRGCIIYDYQGSVEHLRWLNYLPSLQDIAIVQSKVGDEVCEYLRDLGNLRNISLHGTLVTDFGIARLGELQNLELLIVGDTAVTQHGRNALKQRLSKCKIVDSVPVVFQAA